MENKFVNNTATIVTAVAGLALASQISFDVPIGNGIPITGQSFAVLMIGYFLPWKLSLFSIIIYIICGVVGLPIFADGSTGLEILLGKTGGYILGFMPAVILVSKWDYSKRKNLSHTFQTFVFATGIILIIGVVRLSLDLGMPLALEYGFKPFWIGAIVKILLAISVVYVYLRYSEDNKPNTDS
jgi:biotin transport system substrate-specific component